MLKDNFAGTTVKIKKGSLVKSMHPQKSQYVLSRSQHVAVHHTVVNDIVWTGTGRYWCWTDKSNVVENKEK